MVKKSYKHKGYIKGTENTPTGRIGVMEQLPITESDIEDADYVITECGNKVCVNKKGDEHTKPLTATVDSKEDAFDLIGDDMKKNSWYSEVVIKSGNELEILSAQQIEGVHEEKSAKHRKPFAFRDGTDKAKKMNELMKTDPNKVVLEASERYCEWNYHSTFDDYKEEIEACKIGAQSEVNKLKKTKK